MIVRPDEFNVVKKVEWIATGRDAPRLPSFHKVQARSENDLHVSTNHD